MRRTIQIGGSPNQINKMLDKIRQKRFNEDIQKHYLKIQSQKGECEVTVLEQTSIDIEDDIEAKVEQVIENQISDLVLEERSKR